MPQARAAMFRADLWKRYIVVRDVVIRDVYGLWRADGVLWRELDSKRRQMDLGYLSDIGNV